MSFPPVSCHELVAGKIFAAVERVAPRDLYDLVRLSGHFDFHDQMFRALYVGLSAVLLHPLHSYRAERFSRVDAKAMETQLERFLRAGVAMDAAATISQAQALISPLLTLTESERQYVDYIAAGEIRPDLLFPSDPEICARLTAHPAVQWKLKNVRDHLGKN